MVSSTAPSRRPNNTTLLALFAALSLAGAWFMRIVIILNDVPVAFSNVIEAGVLPNGTRFKKYYTGIGPLDEMLSFLVAAFLYGPTGWNEAFYWQQLHFLGQIAPIIAIMNVEACREKHQSSWLKYTSVFAFVYQNIGGAVIIPIWFFLICRLSAEKSSYSQGRFVPLPYARAILPGVAIFYALPTVAIFWPGLDLITLQNVLAFWQASPVLANIPLWIASPFVTSIKTSTASKAKTADLPHLKILYGVFFLTSVAVHWYTIYGISSTTDPSVTYASVWVPSTYKWKNSFDSGLLYIFQCDWVVCGLVVIVAAFVAVYDVQRLIHGTFSGEQFIETGTIIVALAWLAGPGAMISAVWYWREQKLVSLEQHSGARALKKGQ